MWQATLATRAAVFMMGVLFQAGGVRAVRRGGAVAVKTEFVGRLTQLSVGVGSVYVMA